MKVYLLFRLNSIDWSAVFIDAFDSYEAAERYALNVHNVRLDNSRLYDRGETYMALGEDPFSDWELAVRSVEVKTLSQAPLWLSTNRVKATVD